MSLAFVMAAVIIAVVTRQRFASLPCGTEGRLFALTESAAAITPDSSVSLPRNGDPFDQLQPFQTAQSWRFGIGVPIGAAQATWVPRLGAGWWYSWQVQPLATVGGEMWQIIRVKGGQLSPPVEKFTAVACLHPGQTWIVGNEPDVAEQDNVPAETLAGLYRQAHTALKRADPSAQVAMGGVTQASPLRLAYLDKVLKVYEERYGEPMPVDIWTVHTYLLREERGGWGVGIPPSMDENNGWLLEIDQHNDLEKFKTQVVAFRQWMADHGYRNKPLAITEYGILLPADLGFSSDRVQRFMLGSFDYLLRARDTTTGLPSDDYHLVQRWAWFSMADEHFPGSNLLDPARGELTPLGEAYRNYVSGLR